jgi:hypothetical protein
MGPPTLGAPVKRTPHLHGPACSSVLLEKFIVVQPVKKSPTFMEPKDSLSCSEEPATGFYPEPD